MKAHCHRCNEEHELIEKMGGFICSKCRVILAEAYSAQWSQYRKESAAKAQEGMDDPNHAARFGSQKSKTGGMK